MREVGGSVREDLKKVHAWAMVNGDVRTLATGSGPEKHIITALQDSDEAKMTKNCNFKASSIFRIGQILGH